MKPTTKPLADKPGHSNARTVTAQVSRVGRMFRSVLFPGQDTPHAVAAPAAPGSSPGIESIAGSVSCQCIDYGPEQCSLTDISDLDTWLKAPRAEFAQVRWINVNGLHPWVVNRLREQFGFHTKTILAMAPGRNAAGSPAVYRTGLAESELAASLPPCCGVNVPMQHLNPI